MDLCRLLTGLLCVAAQEEDGTQRGQTESLSKSSHTSGLIQMAPLCSHVHVPTWKHNSWVLHGGETALISGRLSSRWGTLFCLLCPQVTQVGFV